jgi:H+/Cl- antiporter ClcA
MDDGTNGWMKKDSRREGNDGALSLPKPQPTYLPTDPPTHRISYLPVCFFSYLLGFCTYFLISCFLTTYLTYLLTISLKNHPIPTYLPASLVLFPTSLVDSLRRQKVRNEFSLNLPFTFSPFSYRVTIRV